MTWHLAMSPAGAIQPIGDHAGWRHAPDQVAAGFGKPQVAIRACRDPLQTCAGADAVTALCEVAVDDLLAVRADRLLADCLGLASAERQCASEYDEQTQDLVHEQFPERTQRAHASGIGTRRGTAAFVSDSIQASRFMLNAAATARRQKHRQKCDR